MTLEDLSDRILELEQQVLALPSRSDWSALMQLNVSRFNSLNNTLTNLCEKFEELNQKIVALQLSGTSSNGAVDHEHVFSEFVPGADGNERAFSLSGAPVSSSSILLYKNGLLMAEGSGNDFVLSGSTVTFHSQNTPEIGSNIVASYLK